MGPLSPMGPTLLKPFKKRPHLGPLSGFWPHPKQKATKLALNKIFKEDCSEEIYSLNSEEIYCSENKDHSISVFYFKFFNRGTVLNTRQICDQGPIQ